MGKLFNQCMGPYAPLFNRNGSFRGVPPAMYMPNPQPFLMPPQVTQVNSAGEAQERAERERREAELRQRLEVERIAREQQESFVRFWQQIISNDPTLSRIAIGELCPVASPRQAGEPAITRVITDIEILQLLQALRNNIPVRELTLQGMKLNAAASAALCDVIKNKPLTKIDLTNMQFPVEMRVVLQEALANPKSRAMQIIGFIMPQPQPAQTVAPEIAAIVGLSNGAYRIRLQDLQIGVVVPLGESGANGIVHYAMWHGQEVAVKKLRAPELTVDGLRDFVREGEMMWNLRHNNIVGLRGICFEPERGHYSLVIEYMPKGSLFTVLHSGEPLSWSRRLRFALDITRGVQYLHERNIFHRDLKSGNVLIDAHYNAKIADFGLAKVYAETRTTTRLPQQDSAGTLAWIAPELFAGKPTVFILSLVAGATIDEQDLQITAQNTTPIIIKRGDEVLVFGNSNGTWKLTPLDRARCCGNCTFPVVGKTPREITPKDIIIQEIRAKGGHDFAKLKRTKACDVYSCGVIFWEIAARKTPRSESATTNSVQIIEEIKGGDREVIPQDTPSRFAALISRCWDGRAEARPSIEQVRVDLEAEVRQAEAELARESEMLQKQLVEARQRNLPNDIAQLTAAMERIGEQVKDLTDLTLVGQTTLYA